MQPREYVINQIKHKGTDPVPFTIGFEDEMRDKLDAYYGGPGWDADLQPYMRIVAHADTLLRRPVGHEREVDAYGARWRLDKKLWSIENNLLTESSFKGYTFPELSVFTDPIYAQVEQAIARCKEPDGRFCYIDMGWGIYERGWMLRGFEDLLMDMICEPGFVQELLGRITDIYVGMIKACADIPADAFLFGDDWGDQRGVIMGPELWRKFIKPCWKRVYDEVHKQGKFVMSHSCGSIHDILEDAIEIGLDVYESVQPEPDKMDSFQLKKEFGDRLTFWGCLGTQSIIPFGTPDEIRAHMRRLSQEVGRDGGFILAPTKPLQPDTPVENAVAIIEELRSAHMPR